jgi:hypothetical protein
LTPVTTSTRRSPRNESAMLEGVPPNMSVRISTPVPSSTRSIASRMFARISSIDCLGSTETAANPRASGTISRSAWRSSSPSR